MAADHPLHKGGSCNPCHQWLNRGNYYYSYIPLLLPLPCHQWVNQSALLLAMKSKSPSKDLDGHWHNTEPPEWSDALWICHWYSMYIQRAIRVAAGRFSLWTTFWKVSCWKRIFIVGQDMVRCYDYMPPEKY